MPVQQNKAATYVNVQSKVMAVAPAQTFAVQYADANGKLAVAIVIVFGKSADGQPMVFVMADNEELTAKYKIATPTITEAVRQHIAAQKPATPESLSSGDAQLSGEQSSLDDLGL